MPRKKRAPLAERKALERIGLEPVETQPRQPWEPPNPHVQAHERTGQTFVYHVCDSIAQGGWPALQPVLNNFQRDLEEIYGPWVELVNVYRKNTTKDDGICFIAIFKCGPFLLDTNAQPFDAAHPPQVRPKLETTHMPALPQELL